MTKFINKCNFQIDFSIDFQIDFSIGFLNWIWCCKITISDWFFDWFYKALPDWFCDWFLALINLRLKKPISIEFFQSRSLWVMAKAIIMRNSGGGEKRMRQWHVLMTCQFSCHIETFVVTAGSLLQFSVPTLPPRIQFRQRVGVPELLLCKTLQKEIYCLLQMLLRSSMLLVTSSIHF